MRYTRNKGLLMRSGAAGERKPRRQRMRPDVPTARGWRIAVRESALRGVRCIIIYRKTTTDEVKRYEVIPTEYAYRRNRDGRIRKVLWVQDCNDGSDRREIKCFYVRNIMKAAVTRRRVRPKWPILIV